jgi:hypothetical protein
VVVQIPTSSQQVAASAESVSESSVIAANDAKLGVIQVKKAIEKIKHLSNLIAQFRT